MKRKLFWVSFPFLAISLLIVGVVASICQFVCDVADGYSDLLNDFKNWCLGNVYIDPDDHDE